MEKQPSTRHGALEKLKSFRGIEKQRSFKFLSMERQHSFKRNKDSPGKRGDTTLHLAARAGNVVHVQKIFADCDPELVGELAARQNQDGETALYVSAEKGHVDVVCEILKVCDVHSAGIKANNSFDALHIAAKQGHLDVLKELLHAFPALAMTTNSVNATALDTAATQGHIDIVNLLLETDASLARIARNNGKTVLHSAARMGHVEVVTSLLSKDPGVGFRTDKKGQTALHMASKGQNAEILLELLKPDVSVIHVEDNKGNRPLHVATRKGNTIIVQTLISVEGIEINAVNRAGETAFAIAEKVGNEELANILREAGGITAKEQVNPPSSAKLERLLSPVSVSLGVIRSIQGKLERLLSPESGHGQRLRKAEKNKIWLLRDHLQELIDKYLIEPSEAEPPASTVRCWLKEVRELSYDIDDFLDELIHGLQAKNFRGKVASLREGLSRSRWVADETSRFRTRLGEAMLRHKRYNLDKHQHQDQGRQVRIDSDVYPIIPPLYGVDAARLVGIDSTMEKLSEWLTGDYGEPSLTVASIVGFGGIGKTTLARELYAKLGRQFECRAFAPSSQKPDMSMLLTSILLQVRRHQVPDDLERRNLIDTIRTHLRHKKYFIIIDDIWDSSTWDIVHRAFPNDKCYSRILTTTEFDTVAQRCCSDTSSRIFKMEPLSDKGSTELFFSRFVDNQSETFEECNQVSSKIIRKCGGLPLPTIVTANILARQQEKIELYNHINRSLGSNLRTNPTMEGMKQVLGLCYNNLPDHLKSCMLYLSVYKEGHIIKKDDLLMEWIAEGFIGATDGIHIEVIAGTYFDDLVNVGLIQPVDISYNDEVISCTVHYMVLNLIRYKSVEENFVTAIDHSQTNTRLADKIRRLSLHLGDENDAEPPANLRLSQVRSLIFFGLFKSLPPIVEFQLLRVLILHPWGDRDNLSLNLTTVCKLFRLRYLKIVCNVTLNLQTKMQGLQYLDTLKIDSRLSEVPPDIVHLSGLLRLSLPGDTNLPNDIRRLVSLQSLGCFDLSSNSTDNVLQLGELTNLQDLRLTCSTASSDNLEKNLQCLGSILSKLHNLKSLILLRVGPSIENTLEDSTFSYNISCDGLSSVSSPPTLLHKLVLLPRICILSILPEWIGKLRLLSILKIQVMGLSNKDIYILGRLPVLSALMLYIRTTPADRIVFDERFPVLKHFKFICSALCISFVKGSMPNVRKLKLGFNADTVLEYNPVDVRFEHLTGLKEISAKIGSSGADDSCRMTAQHALEAAFVPLRVNIHWMDWFFYCEKEMSAAYQNIKDQSMQNFSPIPDDITKGGSHDLLGSSSPSSSLETFEGLKEHTPRYRALPISAQRTTSLPACSSK